jgi:hypothetical protein
VAAMVVLAGAEWAARHTGARGQIVESSVGKETGA